MSEEIKKEPETVVVNGSQKTREELDALKNEKGKKLHEESPGVYRILERIKG